MAFQYQNVTPPRIPADTSFASSKISTLYPVGVLGPYTSWKLVVTAVSISNITLLSTQIIDGVMVQNGDRVLVTGQTNQTQNGIYTVIQNEQWQRSNDMQTGVGAGGIGVIVNQGTLYANTLWVCTNAGGLDVVGTNNLIFTEIAGPNLITVPAPPPFSVQYNNAGAFGGSNQFLFDPTASSNYGHTYTGDMYLGLTATSTTLPYFLVSGQPTNVQAYTGGSLVVAGGDNIAPQTLGPAGGAGSITLQGGNSINNGYGGNINLNCGNGGTASGHGGNISGVAGSSVNGLGGNVSFTAGNTSFTTPGSVSLTSGSGIINAPGGPIILTAGNGGSTGGDGGSVDIVSGSALNGTGGDINLNAGSASNGIKAGSVDITAGTGLITADGGNITLISGAGGTTSGNGGGVTLTAGDSINNLGGNVTISSGRGLTGGGNIVIQGPPIAGNTGGNITLTASFIDGGNGGSINLTSGNSSNFAGNIVLTAGTGAMLGSTPTPDGSIQFITNVTPLTPSPTAVTVTEGGFSLVKVTSAPPATTDTPITTVNSRQGIAVFDDSATPIPPLSGIQIQVFNNTLLPGTPSFVSNDQVMCCVVNWATGGGPPPAFTFPQPTVTVGGIDQSNLRFYLNIFNTDPVNSISLVNVLFMLI